MTVEEIINKALSSSENFKNHWDFKKDALFMDYLYNHFPVVYDFVSNPDVKLVYTSKVDIAAILVEDKNNVSLYLNPDRITYVIEEKWDKDNFPTKNYECIAGLLLHEFLHFYLKHFSEIITEKNSGYLNYAQDIIIDNLIKQQISEWRNWKNYIDKINEKINDDSGIKKISLTKETGTNFKYVLDMYDWELVYVLERFGDKIEPERCFESSQNGDKNNNNPTQDNSGDKEKSGNNSDEKENSSDSQDKSNQRDKNQNAKDSKGDSKEKNKMEENDKSLDSKDSDSDSKSEPKNNINDVSKVEDKDNAKKDEQNNDGNDKKDERKGKNNEDIIDKIFDELAKNQRKRESLRGLDEIYKDNGEFNVGDEIVKAIYEKRNKNLYNFLVKFLRKINEKSKVYTWKKSNKRFPGYFPGYRRVVKPGDVVVIVDTSQSMREYLEKYYSTIMSEIKDSFEKIEKVFGQPSNFYYVDISETIHNRKDSNMGFVKIDKVQKLIDIGYTFGGGTDYSDIFEKIINWKKTSFAKKSKSIFPDIILFLSDIEADFGFMYINEKISPIYKKLSNNLIWLKVGFAPDPPIGYVIDVSTPVWSRIRRKNA